MEHSTTDLVPTMPAPQHYDVIIVGSGSGNTIADDRFADTRVAIVDHGVFGGTCLNRGCIPTKMYVYPADLIEAARRLPSLGVDATIGQVSWSGIRDRIFGRIDPISAGGRDWRATGENVDLYDDTARFIAPRTLQVGEHVITGDQIVLATGSRPRIPDVDGYDEATSRIHTSESIMRLEKLPRSLIIVGGGYIAVEFAHVFSSFGVQVTIVNRSDRLLSHMDADISRAMTDVFFDRVRVGLRQELARFVPRQNGITVYTVDKDGTEYEYDAEVCLVATGRIPNSDTLDLERAGIETHEDGRIKVDEHMATTAEGVFALGDVCSTLMLKHVANHQARVVAHNLLHPDDLRSDELHDTPFAIFTSPEVASVGLTEQQARDEGFVVAVGRQDAADVAFGWAMELAKDTCFVKVVAERDTLRILGAHIVAPHAALLLQPIVTAMANDVDALTLARGEYWIHPAFSEVVENALLAAAQESGASIR